MNDYAELLDKITLWAKELGFAHLGVSDVKLESAEKHLKDWLARKFLVRNHDQKSTLGTIGGLLVTGRFMYAQHHKVRQIAVAGRD